MSQFVAGIDFGTTNSSAAISSGGVPRMVDAEAGHDTIPTALFFPDKSMDVYFGRAAIGRYRDADMAGRFMRSIKRILGTDLMDSATVVGGRSVRFTDIVTHFMRYMKSRIDAAAGTSVDSVVIGRPVHFRDNDVAGDMRAESELERIATAAGFKNIGFQFEPIAAAFAHEQNLTADKLAFVVDVGGGTSDFTVIRLSPARRDAANRANDILANTGVRIGGNDFDRDLALRTFMPMYGMGSQYRSGDKILDVPNSMYVNLATWSNVGDVYNYKALNTARGYVVWGCAPVQTARLYHIIENRLGHTNLDTVEYTKMRLSDDTDVHVCLDFLPDAPTLDVSRGEFECAIKQNVNKMWSAVDQCLNAAGVKNTDIELVVLTGGSTEIPYIANMVRTAFPNAEISAGNKLASVGLGLAYDARRRFLSE